MSVELPKDSIAFSFEKQYRTVSWEATLQTLHRVGQEIDDDTPVFPYDSELADGEDQYSPERTIDTIRTLSRIAFQDTKIMRPFLLKNRGNKNRHYSLLSSANLLVPTDAYNKKSINPDLSLSLSLYHSNYTGLKDRMKKYNLNRFDDDIDSIAGFFAPKLVEHIASKCPEAIANELARVQHNADMYLGMWDKERQLQTTDEAIRQPYLPIQTPESSLQQQPEPHHRLQASA